MITIKEYRAGKQAAKLVNTDVGFRVMVEYSDGFSDWPIKYPDGKIAYDYPERLNKTMRVLVNRAFRYWERRNTLT